MLPLRGMSRRREREWFLNCTTTMEVDFDTEAGKPGDHRAITLPLERAATMTHCIIVLSTIQVKLNVQAEESFLIWIIE
jgi:hypothetical protein